MTRTRRAARAGSGSRRGAAAGARGRARPLAALLVAVAVLAGGAAPVAPAAAAAPPGGTVVDRLAGPDRYATAVAVSADTFPAGAPVVHLATGRDVPDALAAGPAAATRGGPVLLTEPDRLPAVVAAELARLRPAAVVVLGGTAAVGTDVLAQVRDAAPGAAVQRVGGTDRFETAARLSAATFPAGTGGAWVATGLAAPDALSGSAAAGAAREPVLLVGSSGVPPPVAEELARLRPDRVVVLGGTAAVPAATASALASTASGARLVRVAGPDRYATSAAVSGHAFPGDAARVYLAAGDRPTDALVGAPAAARASGPVLLTRPDCLPEDVAAEVRGLTPARVTLLGGSAVLAPGLADLPACPPPVPDGEVAPGVELTTLRDRSGPHVARVVTVTPGSAATLDTVLAGDRLPGLETTSAMAARRGALVALNGDYAAPSGRPVHVAAEDGRLHASALVLGRALAWAADGTRLAETATDRLRVTLTGPDGAPRRVDRVNDGGAAPGVPALATAAGGGAAVPAAPDCGVRLRLVGPPALPAAGAGVTRATAVTEPACARPAPVAAGEVVVATDPVGPPLPWGRGDAVTWEWSLDDRPGVLDVIGGNPVLVEAGQVVEGSVRDDGSSFLRRHPRTAVGVTADDRVLLVAVDGRQPGHSVGMTLAELADLFVGLGAVEALNLDGGGSTTLVVAGRVVNRPSDGPERPVSGALLVLPGADPGEADVTGIPARPEPGREAGAAATAPGVPAEGVRPADEVWPAVARDPGSTGGLLGLVP